MQVPARKSPAPGRAPRPWSPPPLLELREVMGTSLEALNRRKLRSLLSVLGIVIGVAAVTAMLSVGEGARREVIRQVELLGLNNLMLRPRSIEGAGTGLPLSAPVLTFADLERLRTLIPSAAAWSPIVERFVHIAGPARAEDASVLGVAPEYQRIMGLAAAHGRLLGAWDIQQDKRVCVLGSSMSKTLFGRSDTTGQLIRIGGTPYTVVGVLNVRASPGTAGGTLSPRDLNTAVLVPARPESMLGPSSPVTELWMQVAAGASIVDESAVVGHALQRLHRGRRDFDVLVPKDLLDQRLHAQRTFDIVLGSVALLSLLVGGIGVMNMMLTAILERTHEIGLRRAVGATRQWIVRQFLVESVLITAAGGIFGVIFGVSAAAVVTRYAGWPTHVSLRAIGMSLAISAVVGLSFGTYPALRAADLDPIDALRTE